MKKEIYNLQVARGLAAIIVVLGHLTPPYINKFLPNTQLGVSIFFCLSGFIMIQTFKIEDTFFSFMRKRMVRIYPSYIIISFPMIIFFSLQANSVEYFIHSFFFIPWVSWESNPISQSTRNSIANPIAWTLFYEIYFYVIFSLSKTIFPESKRKVVLATTTFIISGILITTCLFGPDVHPGYFEVTWKAMIGNLCMFPFIFGMLGALTTNIKLKKSPLIFLIIPVSTLLIRESHAYTENTQIIDLLLSGIPCSVLLIYLAKTEKFSGYICNKLYNVGIYSYSLYLFHANLLVLMGKINKDIHLDTIFKLSISVLFIIISLFSSKWLYHNVESRFFLKKQKE